MKNGRKRFSVFLVTNKSNNNDRFFRKAVVEVGDAVSHCNLTAWMVSTCCRLASVVKI
jgi:hypothetical protein